MITSITVRGLGPLADTTVALRPVEVTTIRGRSDAGKTTLLNAVCWALWGVRADGRPLPPEAIREGCERAEVVVELSSGSTIRRTQTRAGSQTRTTQRRGQAAVRHASESALRTALGPLGNPDLRYVLAPGADPGRGWQALAAGHGRDLAALLARATAASGVLRDLGPVSLRTDDGTAASPAVEVLLDGRPWDLASTGRQIVGDAAFRSALRRALRVPWLPIWVDRRQDVGGQIVDVVAPAVMLVTDDGELRTEVG
jgi:hypothetical protein